MELSAAAAEPGIQRERLEALMLFRVILVTLFLGGALLLDVGALADFSDVRNATIVVLIVGVYALTIFYALLLRASASLRELAVTQLTLDVVVVGVLVNAYGGIDSPFLFLFLLIVISTALTLGRRAAVNSALAVSAMLALLAAQRLGLFAEEPAGGWVWKATLFRVALNGSAALIVAMLAGYLTELLGEATSRLEAQQASLDELRALHDNILASLSSGLITLDRRGDVIFFNVAAEQILGVSSQDVLRQPFSDVFPSIADITSPEVKGRGELSYERPDGSSVFIGFSTSPLLVDEEEHDGRIIIFQDLSEIKRLESEVRRSERLAAVGKLAAAIAHEIRNPLAAISGSVEMLSADETFAADDQDLLRIVVREVDRLNKLITDFLEYSRPRPLTLGPTNLVSEVERALDLFQRRTDVAVSTQFECERELEVDAEALQQVLWNLLHNAANAASDHSEAPRVRVRLLEDDDSVTLLVEDNGAGIADEHLDRIFQPFFTTRRGGTGLGLATIFRLVEAHGAQIIAHPHGELGGATFELRFSRTATPPSND